MDRKYLTLTAQKGNPVPQIAGWYGKLDVRDVNREDYKKIPSPLMLGMRTGPDTVFPDIMTSPVLMVSEEAMEVILLYDRDMPYFFVVLSDAEHGQGAAYYCPVLADDAHGGKEAIYRVKKASGNEIRICEELAESLLDRGVCGMELQP